MKNIKQATFLSALSLAVAIPLTASAAATTDAAPATTEPAQAVQSAIESINGGDQVIVPFATQSAFDTTLGGQQTVSYFKIPAGLGYVKIWVKNTGSESIKFALHKGSASGPVVKEATIPADGKAWEWRSPSALSTGDFYATFNASNTNMKGQAYGKMASTQSEL
ncbi:hypothetical protein [Paenibacillus medicaginis]|uniref:Uncharacterized protein n=1 Tax=Paenibacillus medicaginis TaxID=1470560 RepID=A0ABV5BZA5_9BACL